MDEIAENDNFKVFEIPVTIACDGSVYRLPSVKILWINL